MAKMTTCSFTIPIRWWAVNNNKSRKGTTDTIMADILHPHLSGEEGNSSYQATQWISPNKMDTQTPKTRRSPKDPVYE
jgi:hypothetical protein